MKRILFFLMILFMFVGCKPEEKNVDKNFSTQVAEEIRFFKHQESGLCFAFIPTGIINKTNLTNVPCEPVEKLLAK